MAHKAPGKHHRSASRWFNSWTCFRPRTARANGLNLACGQKAGFAALRKPQNQHSQPQEDALLVHGLPLLFLSQNRHRHTVIEGPAP